MSRRLEDSGRASCMVSRIAALSFGNLRLVIFARGPLGRGCVSKCGV